MQKANCKKQNDKAKPRVPDRQGGRILGVASGPHQNRLGRQSLPWAKSNGPKPQFCFLHFDL